MVQREWIRDRKHPDYKQGIRAYTVNVLTCPMCKRQTNLLYKSPHNRNKVVLACSAECASKR